MFTALRDFPLSRDGIRAEVIKAGQPVDVPGALRAGLLAEGFIAAIEPALEVPTEGAVETPAEITLEMPQKGAQ